MRPSCAADLMGASPMKIKKSLKTTTAASIALAALAAGPAMAADMPTRAPAPVYTKAPPAPVQSWTGFYVNAGIGYGLWASDTTTVAPTAAGCVGFGCLPITQTQGGKGWFGTAGAGFDYQFTDHIVAGVLADWDFSSIKGTIQDQGPEFAGSLTENWSWAAGARVGWLVTPAILSYVNGGFSQTHFNSATMISTITAGASTAGAPTGFSTPAFTQSGWFLGGGVETSLASFLPGLFSRTEYRYTYYGTTTLTDTCAGASGSAACTGFATPQNSITFHPTEQSIRSELVYKFNWNGTAASTEAATPLYTKAPPAPAQSWTGFYLDAGVGYALWTADTTTVAPSAAGCTVACLPITQTQGGKGWLGTAGGGLDYQFTDHIVAGVLADWDFSSIKGTIQDAFPFFAGSLTENWSWAAGARVGWLVTPAILSYVNGGFSQSHFNSATMVSTNGTGGSAPAGAATGFSTPAFTQSGWFMGGGVETSLASFLPGLFSRTEYRYSYYGTATLRDTCSGVSASAACSFLASPLNSITFHPTEQSIRSELVYKFNWSGPVTAKY